MERKELELYIHIPFCVSKCKYCDFLSAPSVKEERQEYVRSLCKKIRTYREFAKAYHIISIFLGGGTPTILTSEQTEDIFRAIYDTFTVDRDAEITIEMNPGTITEEKLERYKAVGINRLSIGLQSTNNHELRALGRIHTYETFIDTYVMSRKAGFQNINIDLISAIPHQTLSSWEETLVTAALLEPEHISAYSLIIEEGTPFYDYYGEGRHAEELPDEETERAIYSRTKEILEAYDYQRYEISNYARPGYECRHNLGYWNRTEYLGIGTGAASLVNNHRFTEGALPEPVTKNAQIEEFLFLGLRQTRGISKTRFQQTFTIPIETIYAPVLKKLCQQELLEVSEDTIRLTEKGIDLSNYALSQFLLEE